MSPKAADPDVRKKLVEAAARILTEEGPGALTTRRLAREVGASTMAVYTHFDGKDDLVTAMSLEGFRRLGRRLNRVNQTLDSVADVVELGRAYRRNALANPNLYRVMFGTSPVDIRMEPVDAAMTLRTFETLVHAVERCMTEGRFASGDAWEIASQLWAALHGTVMLELSHFLTHAEAVRTSEEMTYNLAVGYGDDPARARRSVAGRAARTSDLG